MGGARLVLTLFFFYLRTDICFFRFDNNINSEAMQCSEKNELTLISSFFSDTKPTILGQMLPILSRFSPQWKEIEMFIAFYTCP